MYRGFNLELNWTDADYHKIGQDLFSDQKPIVQKTLKDFIFSDNSIDGTSIQETWFPKIEADVFLSHAHVNEDTAIALAGWLYKELKLTTFIDSCVWGYSAELLRLIDNKYCFQPANSTYNYHRRNFSTSHVHMMLSSALSMMIDKTECIFFLNTPDSVKPIDGIQKTESPWIYSEIVTTQLVRARIPKRFENLNEEFSGFDGSDDISKATKTFSIKHTLDLGHLTKINLDSLNRWVKSFSNGHALDTLYSLNPHKK